MKYIYLTNLNFIFVKFYIDRRFKYQENKMNWIKTFEIKYIDIYVYFLKKEAIIKSYTNINEI